MFTSDLILSKSISDLADLYNRFADKPVKKFRDKSSAIRRTIDVLRQHGQFSDGGSGLTVKQLQKEAAKMKRNVVEDNGEEIVVITKEKSAGPESLRKMLGAKAPTPKQPKAERTPRVSRFERPRQDEIKEPREGSKRAQVADLLRNGATVEEVMDLTGWNVRQAREGISLLHTYCGFGLTQDSDGVITLVE